MKKIFYIIALFGGRSMSATPVVNSNGGGEIKMTAPATDYTEINANQLPEAVLEALAKDFSSAKLDKAYVNSNKVYKLFITVQEVTSAVHTDRVYADQFGNWLTKDKLTIPASDRHQEITQKVN